MGCQYDLKLNNLSGQIRDPVYGGISIGDDDRVTIKQSFHQENLASHFEIVPLNRFYKDFI